MEINKKLILLKITSIGIFLVFLFAGFLTKQAFSFHQGDFLGHDSCNYTRGKWINNNNGTNWEVWARYRATAPNGNLRWLPALTFWVDGNNYQSAYMIFKYYPRRSDVIKWYTTCVDPRVDVEVSGIDYSQASGSCSSGGYDIYHTYNVNITCRSDRTGTDIYRACDQPNNHGNVGINEKCPGTPDCAKGGTVTVCNEGAKSCGTGNNSCDRYEEYCNFNNSPGNWCDSRKLSDPGSCSNNCNGPIGGRVYIDKNGDNNPDPGEGYTGATVFKDKGTNNQEKRISDPDYNFGGLTGGSEHDIKLEDFPAARLKVEGNNPKINVRVPNSNANFRLNFQKYTIKGHVYWDPDGNGISTTPYSKTVNLTVVGEGRNDTTNDNGAYTINGNPTDLTTDGKKYTLRLTNQRGGDIVEGGRDKTVFIKGSDEVVNFFLTRNAIPTYSLSGGVFIDTDPIGQRNAEGYTNPLNPEKITINGARLNTANFPGSRFDATGFYVPGLSAGGYEVEFPLPIRRNYVVSFHPGRYRITVGPNALNLDFGISQIIQQVSWFQGVGGYMRDDRSGSVTIPSGKFLSLMGSEDTPNLPSLASPGVVFNFNLSGGVSSKGWKVTNSTYRPGVIKTSFDYITDALKKGKATQHNLFGEDGHCGPDDGSGCRIDNPNGGYYYTNGKNVTLDAIDFRANQDYIFRIDGNLTINTGATPWNIPNGTTAIFVVKGNIIVNSNVTHLEGIFSADGNFTINSKTPAADSQLVIEGSVIANALRSSANTKPFDNKRSLGDSNEDTPSVKIIFRPDFVLNAPDLVRYSNYNFQEVAPEGR